MIDVGATLGVEEEYHLVNAATLALADAPKVVPEAVSLLGACAQEEISTSQLEIATVVCSSLEEVRLELARLRRGAADAAAAHGTLPFAAGTHPTATWLEQRMTAGDRYERITARLGLLARQQLIAGTHVHVNIPDLDTAVQVLDRLRPDLATLIALSASSPFWEGVDTGYASYRTQWFARFPVTGSQELLGSAAAYTALVADLVGSGVIEDASHLYWDARPATRFPTVEIRVADTCPRLDDVVLQAALSRSLVRVAAADAAADRPIPQPRSELVRAARWGAARFGLEDRLLDLHTGDRLQARDVVQRLLTRLRPDLEELGDWDEVEALTAACLARGSSAREQRQAYVAGGFEAVSRLVTDQFLR